MRGPLPELPEFVDPFRLARRRAHLRSAVPLAAMTRLGALVRNGAGEAQADFRFAMSAAGAARLDGRLDLLASLTCQRCLGSLDLRLRPEVRVSFTQGGGALERAELAAGYEPLDCTGPIELATLAEDELLLALPEFPMHRRGACAPGGGAAALAPEAAEDGVERLPFSSLGALRARLEQSRT